jgi:hypothetical protein
MWRTAALVVFLLAGRAAPAGAVEPCLPLFTGYGDPAATVTCTCGPPRGLTLGLGELLGELGVEAPKYAGTLEQTIGPLYGTWTYAARSNVCKAAMHAGLFETMDVGGEITLRGSKGCASYEASWQGGWQSFDSGEAGGSFHFPELTLGGCPDEDGYGSRYQGPPAFELLRSMAGRDLRISYAALEHPLLERFTVQKLLIAPQSGPPVVIERLSVGRLDMESLARRFPPRYLILEAEGIALPTALLGAPLAAALGSPRITFAAKLDLRYDLRSGRLTLNPLQLEGSGLAWLWLRGELFDLRPTVLGDPELGPLSIRPHWLRLRLDDRGLAIRVFRFLAGPEGDVAELVAEWTRRLTEAPGGIRTAALRSQVLAWLRDLDRPPAPIELYLQPVEGTTLRNLLALRGDPEGLAMTARLAASYGGAPAAEYLPGEGLPSVAVVTPAPSAADRIVVRYAGMPGVPNDWIAISYVGSTATQYEQYRYLGESTAGEIDFGRVAPGFYEVRALGDRPGGGYELRALAFLRVAP